MKILYFDLSMGAAGDMLSAALLELLPQPLKFVDQLNALGLPGVRYSLEPSNRCGVWGSHMVVTVNGEEEGVDLHQHTHEHSHAHNTMPGIRHILSHAEHLPQEVKEDVLGVYDLIAQAESHVHGCPMEQIHFHEVGTLDAIADITAVCWLMHTIKPDAVYASPIHVGAGTVHCAHGILPVPAPATAFILRGIPTYGGSIQSELCTPTGAALMRYFVKEFGAQPMMAVDALGYGMGMKEFPAANCVRVSLGHTADTADRISCLCCNLDDMTPEDIGYAQEQLLSAGALDVYTTPIFMKKNRPGVELTVLCQLSDTDTMTALLLRHTTTLGVRKTLWDRTVLPRTMETVETPYGPVRFKSADGKSKPEFDDLSQIAKTHDLPMSEVRKMAWDAKK